MKHAFPWSLVTPKDFRRAIYWHRRQPTFAQVLKEAMEKDALNHPPKK